MNGNVKFGLTPGRCLILCALSALIGCALFLFSTSGAEATLALGWFPFTQLQGLTADADGLTPPGVCLAFAALPAVGFLLLLIRRCFRAEDLLLLVCVGLLYHVMRGKLSLEGLMAGEAAVQPAEFWTVLLAWAGVGLGSVSFPVSALIFCFAALLGARFAAAHKRLRDENDMFI